MAEGKRLELVIDASPNPSVQWFKDGQEVKEEFSDGNKHSLIVPESESSSIYSVLVTSSSSSESKLESASGNLTIVSNPVLKNVQLDLNSEVVLKVSTNDFDKSEVNWIKDEIKDQKSASYKLVVTQSCQVVAETPKVTATKPKFSKELSGVSALQDQKNIELEVELEARSKDEEELSVKWFVDDIEIVEADTRYTMTNDQSNNKFKLLVKEANEGTAGMYKCVTSNSAGSSETQAEVTVSSKPEFMQELEDREAMAGDSVQMDVVIAGNPKPSIKWLRNGEDVSSDSSILIEKESDTVYILTIDKVTTSSVGTYECVIMNRVGQTRSKGNLTLLTAPTFAKDLEGDITANVGEDVVLEVIVDSNPRPSIQWFKNDVPMPTQVLGENKDNKYRMRFEPAELTDTAEYHVVAKNRIGEKMSRRIRFTVVTQEIKNEPEKVPEPEPEEVKEAPKEDEPIPPPVEEPAPPVEEPAKPAETTPTILDGLPPNIDLKEGSLLVLTAKVDGNPLPSIKWTKDGLDLVMNERMEMTTGRDGTVTLTIRDVRTSDQGDYQLIVENNQGQITNNTKVGITSEPKPKPEAPKAEPITKPVLKKGLADVSALEGQKDIELVVEVEASKSSEAGAKASVKWYIDDIEITETDSRFTIAKDEASNKYKLVVNNATEKCSGSIKCVLTNSAGRTETSSKLSVSSKPQFVQKLEDREALEGETVAMDVIISGNPKPTVTWLRNGQDVSSDSSILVEKESDTVHILTIEKVTSSSVGEFECVIKNEAGETRTKGTLTLLKTPSLTSDLNGDINAKVGDKVELEITCDGNPPPSVTWFKDGVTVGSEGIAEQDGNKFKLRMDSVTMADAGEYNCVVKNRIGEVSSSKSKLMIEDIKQVETEPKMEQELPSNVQLTEGNVLVLTAKVKGHPLPKVKWLKDGVELKMESRMDMTMKADGTVVLTIRDVQMSDQGEYELICINSMGQVTNKSSVAVNARDVLPKFVKELSRSEVQIGSAAKMEAKVIGVPRPEIKWYKDDLPLKLGADGVTLDGRYKTSYNVSTGDITLDIDNVQEEDLGLFKIVATNIAGEKISIAALRTPRPTVPLKPEFVVHLLDGDFEEGSKLVLSCKVRAYPDPTIRWLCDGQELFPDGERIKVSVDEDGHCLLTIENVDMEDAGKYVCTASNSEGKTRTASQINIFKRPPSRPRTPRTPKDAAETADRQRSKYQPSDFEVPDRKPLDREPIHVSSESHYQQGPDTMLLQHRDPDYPLRVREYLRVGAMSSPSLANNLRQSYWGDADVSYSLSCAIPSFYTTTNEFGDKIKQIGYGFSPQVAVRERRRFSAIVKEIQTEVKTGEPPSRGRRFFSPARPSSSLGYTSGASGITSSAYTPSHAHSSTSYSNSYAANVTSSNYSASSRITSRSTTSSPFKYTRS